MKENLQVKKKNGTDALSLFQTGYVIELSPKQYLTGIKKGRIELGNLEYAKYFQTIDQTVDYVRRYLSFAGLKLQIALACWTLIETESLEGKWRFLLGSDQRAMRFQSYQEAKRYQEEQELYASWSVEFSVFQEKEIHLAA